MKSKIYKLFKYLEEEGRKEIPLVVNANLYYLSKSLKSTYKNKSLIQNEEHLMILDKAYNWLYNLLTDDLNNLKAFVPKPKYDTVHSVIYGTSKDNILLAYDKKNGFNDIHNDNFYLKFESYMEDYITDNKTLIAIIHEYLVNVLEMKGSHTEEVVSFFA